MTDDDERASAADELDGRGAGDTAVDAGLPCSDGKERGRGAADPADPHVFDWRPSSPAGRPPTAPRDPPPPAFPPPPPRPCVSTRLPSPPSPAGPAGRYRVKQQHENVARGSRPTDEGLPSWAQRRLLFKHLLLLSTPTPARQPVSGVVRACLFTDKTEEDRATKCWMAPPVSLAHTAPDWTSVSGTHGVH